MNRGSLVSKIHHLNVGESMVLFPTDYKVFMRTVGAALSRDQIQNVSYKKAHVIVGDSLLVGVLLVKHGEVGNE